MSLVTLAVADLDAATGFYEALGWEVSAASVPGSVAFLDGGTVVLGLFPVAAFRVEVGRAEPGDVRPGDAAGVALATNVSSDEVVDTFLAAALRAGATIVRPAVRRDWGGYSGYFADLDGHLWEVAHNPHASLDADGRLDMHPVDRAASPATVQARPGEIRERADAGDVPLVDDLADRAVSVVDELAARLDEVFAGVGVDRVIATMSELTERSMRLGDGSDRQMRLAAAATLVSGRIGG